MLSISCCYGLLILGGTLAFLLPHIPAEIAFLHEIQYVNVLQRNSLEIHQVSTQCMNIEFEYCVYRECADRPLKQLVNILLFKVLYQAS